MKATRVLSLMGFSLLVLCVPMSLVYAEELEQLLTSAQQRAKIDHERWQAKHPKALTSSGSEQVAGQRQLFFEALLKTEKGYSVWLNGRMYDSQQRLQGIVIDPKQIRAGQLILQTPKGSRRLALGQVYWIDQDKVLEPYEKP